MAGTRYSVDILAGTGLRSQEPNNPIPNGSTVPSYEQVNFGVSHRFENAPGGPIEVRADLINVFDEVYLLRSGSGLGVFASQYGPRRTFFVGVRKLSGPTSGCAFFLPSTFRKPCRRHRRLSSCCTLRSSTRS